MVRKQSKLTLFLNDESLQIFSMKLNAKYIFNISLILNISKQSTYNITQNGHAGKFVAPVYERIEKYEDLTKNKGKF